MKNIKGFLESKTLYKTGLRQRAATSRDLAKAAPKRGIYSDKYSNGRMVLIGGSGRFHGAPAMASLAAYGTLAALRVGAGYAKTYVPEAMAGAVRASSPNIIVSSCGKGIALTNDMKKDISRTDAVVIGMGMESARASETASRRIILYCQSRGIKTIVDAGAIASLRPLLGKRLKEILITPHDSEFSRLLGVAVPKRDLKARIRTAFGASKAFGINILLKGHVTIVTNGKEVKLVKSHSASLATMGTGDVLDGIIGGYAATGAGVFDAAVAGAYLHSEIGDELYKEKGNHILASDVVERIPAIIKKFDKRR
ncbi:MAG: NAD(P)H-hydrate dehydratase [Candidatus Micrarchaeota archaeon]|nr:NAD(P)H-hydrate dehydratase [Candidatus Micrarchaeota archaeon]